MSPDPGKKPDPRIHCNQCGYEGPSARIEKGTGTVEAVLWVLGVISYLFLMPAAVIYSVWRRSGLQPSCPQCKFQNFRLLEPPPDPASTKPES